jgi:hypothetical protein
MSDVIETINLKDGNVLEIFQDSYPESPREWDNLGVVIIFHKRYDFGDTDTPISADDYSNWDEMEEGIKEQLKPLVLLPVYMYEHSGITINTTGFTCRWDSGQVGFIYTTNEKIDEAGCYIKESETWDDYIERIRSYLQGEIKTLDNYITGNVYGFTIKDSDGDTMDSCGGFYGEDYKTNGILDHIDENLFLDDL